MSTCYKRSTMGTGQSGAALVESLARTDGQAAKDTGRFGIRCRIGQRRGRLRRALGLTTPTEAQRMLLDIAARTWWLLERVDDALLDYAARGMERSTQRLLHERTLMADRLTRTLTLLGRPRGPLAPTTTAPRVASPSSKAKRKGSGKAKDSTVASGPG